MKNTPLKARTGFTLIELLAVIAILAVLLAILVPAFSKAKSKANIVKCATQVRQLGTAWELYATTHNGKTPYNGREEGVGNQSPHVWKIGDNLLLFGELFQYLDIQEDITTTPDVLICPATNPQTLAKLQADNAAYKVKVGRYYMNPDASYNPTETNLTHTVDQNEIIICDLFVWWSPNAYNPENHNAEGMNVYTKNGSVRWIPYESVEDVPAWNWKELSTRY